jgi:hypothetical protein
MDWRKNEMFVIFIYTFRVPIQFIFNSLLKITNNNTLVFSITNHMIVYKTTFKIKIPREERFCKFCTEVETEEHFLISAINIKI